MDFKDWKLQNQDPLQYWLSKLSKEQLSLLDEVKNRFNWRIDGFSQIKRDELQIKIDNHFPRAKVEFLERCHAEIVNKTEFLESYRDILTRPVWVNKTLSFDYANLINTDRFNAFIKSFEVVGLSSPYVNDLAEVKAMEYLEDIATLNILEYLRNEIIEKDISGNYSFKETPEWQRALAKLANRFHTDLKPTAKFTVIYLWMLDNNLLRNIDKSVFRGFVQSNLNNHLAGRKFNNFARIDVQNLKYLDNKEQLTKIYKS